MKNENIDMNDLINKSARCYKLNKTKEYTVQGWYMDSNGNLKTYGDSYEESFVDETEYIEKYDSRP